RRHGVEARLPVRHHRAVPVGCSVSPTRDNRANRMARPSTRLTSFRRTTSPAAPAQRRPGPLVSRRAFTGFLVAALLPVRSRAAADGVEGEVRALIEGSGASAVGVAFHDLATGGEVMVRADELFHPASTMKVPVMMEVYRQANEGKLSLDDRITLK